MVVPCHSTHAYTVDVARAVRAAVLPSAASAMPAHAMMTMRAACVVLALAVVFDDAARLLRTAAKSAAAALICCCLRHAFHARCRAAISARVAAMPSASFHDAYAMVPAFYASASSSEPSS